MRDAIITNRPLFIAVAIVLVLIAASYPVTLWIDHRADAKRSLYQDRQMVAWLVYERSLQGVTPSPETITPGQTVTVGNQSFTPAPGNTVTVKMEGTKFCVQVTSDFGPHTGWQCWAPGVKPPKPDDTTIDF